MAHTLLSDSSSDSEDGGAALPPAKLSVNEEYARRFEYNKKREEKARLEEKLGKDSGKSTRKRKRDDGPNHAEDQSGHGSDESDESTSESEDEGELDTEAVDAEMMATIAAIRNRDPKIYDPNARFYTAIDDEAGVDSPAQQEKKEKPLHLRDYHRQNLLNGNAAADDSDKDKEELPLPYNEEQERLKKDIVSSIHAAAAEIPADDEDGFLTAKEKTTSRKASHKPDPVLDVEQADKDPDTFLSNFMASRAWAQHDDDRNLVPFESDDDEEDQRADEYEEAYNLRFEDPAKANEKLRSHARHMAAKYSVRREEANPRQRKREAEKAEKEAAKQQRKEERARLRKLRIEEVEAKVQRIKKAAGLKSRDLQPEDWQHFVDEDWDDKQWEEEMQKRFGDDYYAAEDVDSDAEPGAKSKKPKKPKFDDDIDIKDLVPDFDDEPDRAKVALSDDDEDNVEAEDGEAEAAPRPKGKKEKEEKRREAKRDRRIIEALVDDQLKLDLKASTSKSSAASFRYRATSPQSFGLTATDILLAEDSQLNEFVGLKKLAAFRDPEKKKRDKKHLGKKGRLRKWREDVFGKDAADGVKLALEKKRPIEEEDNNNNDNDEEHDNEAGEGGVKIVDGPRKKKRRRKNKA
ncbi:hypothetical protein DV735_g4888, partial [Chaetothyriales sp. CBS 134920]